MNFQTVIPDLKAILYNTEKTERTYAAFYNKKLKSRYLYKKASSNSWNSYFGISNQQEQLIYYNIRIIGTLLNLHI